MGALPYTEAGTLRFFRVENSWLLEIGRDGRPLSVPYGLLVGKNAGKEGPTGVAAVLDRVRFYDGESGVITVVFRKIPDTE